MKHLKFQRRQPIGIRYKNPLNIKRNPRNNWLGKDKENKGTFEMFHSFFYGYRAAMILVKKHILLGRCTTIGELISIWAPPSENGEKITRQYQNFVAEGMTATTDDVVRWENRRQICDIVYLMTIFENGSPRLSVNEEINGIGKCYDYPKDFYSIIEQAYDAVRGGSNGK